MFVPRVNSGSIVSAVSKRVSPKASKSASKLNDVAISPWELDKMISEKGAKNVANKNNQTMKFSSTCNASYGDWLAMGFAC